MIKPCAFLPTNATAHRTNDGVSIASICTLSSVRIEGFAAYDPETGKVNVDVSDPSSHPFFLILAKPHSGQSYYVLSDNDVYIPVSGKTNLKVDHTDWLKRGSLTTIDQLLIREAIRIYAMQFR